MDKTLLTFVGGVLLVAFVFFAMANATLFSNQSAPVPSGYAPSGNGSLPDSGSPAVGGTAAPQIVQLSVQGASYVTSPATVKENQPVRFVADMQNMPGCSRSFVIPQLGIRKVFQQGDNVLEFTPTQTGTLSFSCSMGMYRGTLNVV